MTCIVGIQHDGRVYIGGDSAGVAGYSITSRADAKVFTVGPYVMGFTSSFRMGQLLRYGLKAPKPPVVGSAVRQVLGGVQGAQGQVVSAADLVVGYLAVGARGRSSSQRRRCSAVRYESEQGMKLDRILGGIVPVVCATEGAIVRVETSVHA